MSFGARERGDRHDERDVRYNRPFTDDQGRQYRHTDPWRSQRPQPHQPDQQQRPHWRPYHGADNRYTSDRDSSYPPTTSDERERRERVSAERGTFRQANRQYSQPSYRPDNRIVCRELECGCEGKAYEGKEGQMIRIMFPRTMIQAGKGVTVELVNKVLDSANTIIAAHDPDVVKRQQEDTRLKAILQDALKGTALAKQPEADSGSGSGKPSEAAQSDAPRSSRHQNDITYSQYCRITKIPFWVPTETTGC